MYAYVRARRISRIYHSPPIRSEAYWKPSVPMPEQSSAPAGTAAVIAKGCAKRHRCVRFRAKVVSGVIKDSTHRLAVKAGARAYTQLFCSWKTM